MKVMTIANTNIDELVEVQNEQVVTDSRKVAEVFGKRTDHVMRDIDNIKKDAPNFGEMFFEAEAPDSYGRPQRIYYLNRDGLSLLVMGFTGKKAMEWKLKYIEAFNAMEKQLREQSRPKTQLDILVESVKALQEQERRLARTELDIADIKKGQQEQARRINTLNGVCTEGTKRQQLVAMITAYARNAGITYDRAWRDFKGAYNTAFHTNISLSRRHYMEEKGLKKKPSVPEFLEAKELLDDALRIADKLLSGAAGVA